MPLYSVRRILVGLLLMMVNVSCAQCDESDAGGDGWQFDPGLDTGVDSGSIDSGSVDISVDDDAGPVYELECVTPAPSEAAPGVTDRVLVANAGLGLAFGHPHERSSWGVANVLETSDVELGNEHIFSTERALELFSGDGFAYLGSVAEPRVALLDASAGFGQIFDYILPAPSWISQSTWEIAAPTAATYSELSSLHYVAFEPSTLAIISRCSDGRTSLRYLDLRDDLGPETTVTHLSTDASGRVVGTAQSAGGGHFFALDATSNSVTDLDPESPGVQLIDLPRPTYGTEIRVLESGDLLVNVSEGVPGSFEPELSGGLLVLRAAEPGRWRLDEDYLMTAEDLGGNPAEVIIIDEGIDRYSGVALVDTELGAVAVLFEYEDGSVAVEQIDGVEREAVHLCVDSSRREAWLPSSDGQLYRLDLADGALRTVDQQFNTIPHHCMFGQ